jgi:hypothetical protein
MHIFSVEAKALVAMITSLTELPPVSNVINFETLALTDMLTDVFLNANTR